MSRARFRGVARAAGKGGSSSPRTVAARVANHSAERRSARIALTIGTRRRVETVEVEPWGEGQLFFEDEIPGEGAEVLVAASIEGAEDGLAGDDRRWSVVRQRERLRAATAGDAV